MANRRIVWKINLATRLHAWANWLCPPPPTVSYNSTPPYTAGGLMGAIQSEKLAARPPKIDWNAAAVQLMQKWMQKVGEGHLPTLNKAYHTSYEGSFASTWAPRDRVNQVVAQLRDTGAVSAVLLWQGRNSCGVHHITGD